MKPFFDISPSHQPRLVNYAEAGKVLEVFDWLGFKVIVHTDMPPNELHLVEETRNGTCVHKLILTDVM